MYVFWDLVLCFHAIFLSQAKSTIGKWQILFTLLVLSTLQFLLVVRSTVFSSFIACLDVNQLVVIVIINP